MEVLVDNSERSTKCLMKPMVESGKIEHIGGRRYGNWKGNAKVSDLLQLQNNDESEYAITCKDINIRGHECQNINQ